MVCRKCSTVTTRKTHDGPKAGKTMWYAWYFHCLSCGWLYMPDEAKRTLKLLRSATTAPRVGAAQKVPCQKPTAAIPVEELAAHMRINPNKLRQYLAAPLPAVDDDVEAVTPANVEVDLDYLEAEYQRFVASTPADEVETSAVEEDEEILPPLGHPAPAGANHNMPDWPFQTEHVPEEEVEMVLVFGHMVPLSSVTFSSDSEEVATAAARAEAYAVMSAECFAQIAARRVQEGWEPLDSVTVIDDDEPSRPQREPVSMEVERRLALRGGESFLVKAADIEQEILIERYKADLAAGLINDEDFPF
jgi:hypothetical protein